MNDGSLSRDGMGLTSPPRMPSSHPLITMPTPTCHHPAINCVLWQNGVHALYKDMTKTRNGSDLIAVQRYNDNRMTLCSCVQPHHC